MLGLKIFFVVNLCMALSFDPKGLLRLHHLSNMKKGFAIDPIEKDDISMDTEDLGGQTAELEAAIADMQQSGENTELLIDDVVNPMSNQAFQSPVFVDQPEYEALGPGMFQPDTSIQDQLVQEQFLKRDVIEDVDNPPSGMAQFWGDVYQSESNRGKMRLFDQHQSDYDDINSEARNSIANASILAGDIFSGDEGIQGHKLAEILTQTALHESGGGRYDEQQGGGPAQGYWQVEPTTARDLLKNSRAYFGPKAKAAINEAMGSNIDLNNLSDDELDRLLKTPMGGAIFGGAKYLAGAKAKGRLDFLR